MPPIYSSLPCGPPPSVPVNRPLRSDMHIVSGRTQGRWRALQQDTYLPAGSVALTMRMRPEHSLRSQDASEHSGRPPAQYGEATSASAGYGHRESSNTYQPRLPQAVTQAATVASSAYPSHASTYTSSFATQAARAQPHSGLVDGRHRAYSAGVAPSYVSQPTYAGSLGDVRRASDVGMCGTATKYPDSTLMPSRPSLNVANATAGSHVVTSGLHSNIHRSYGMTHSTRDLPASAAAVAAKPLGSGGIAGQKTMCPTAHNDVGAQSRLLVGSRGYSRTTAWPVRHVQMPQTRAAPANVDLNSLGLTDEIFEISAARARLHWDATGQYTQDQIRRFIEKACIRMELDLLCLLTAMLYMDRLRAKFPDAGSCSCAKRVLTMGLLTASKYHKDNPFDNKSWARFCDLGLLTMNGMELQFIEALGFELFISPDHITTLLDSIQKEQGVSLHAAAQAIFEVLTPQPSTPASPTFGHLPATMADGIVPDVPIAPELTLPPVAALTPAPEPEEAVVAQPAEPSDHADDMLCDTNGDARTSAARAWEQPARVLADGGEGPVARMNFYTRGTPHDAFVIPAEGLRMSAKPLKSDFLYTEYASATLAMQPACVAPF